MTLLTEINITAMTESGKSLRLKKKSFKPWLNSTTATAAYAVVIALRPATSPGRHFHAVIISFLKGRFTAHKLKRRGSPDEGQIDEWCQWPIVSL